MATKSKVVLVDTSVAVAAAVAGHAYHASAREAIRGLTIGLSGHAWFETYSVLTRLPADQRREPGAVSAMLRHNFPETRWLPTDEAARLASSCARLGIAGGAIYDALVGAAAAAHDLPLITRDRRALATYHLIGTDVTLIT